MPKTGAVIGLILVLVGVAYLTGSPTHASHTELRNYEPFDAHSFFGTLVGSPCDGITGEGGNGDHTVRSVQSILYGDRLYGPGSKYGGVVDGEWGPATENAVRDYQAFHNLQVDGCFGGHSANHVQGGVNLHGNHMTPDDNGVEFQPIDGNQLFTYIYSNLCGTSCSGSAIDRFFRTKPDPNDNTRFQELYRLDQNEGDICQGTVCLKRFIECEEPVVTDCFVY